MEKLGGKRETSSVVETVSEIRVGVRGVQETVREHEKGAVKVTDWKLDEEPTVISDDGKYRYKLTRFLPKFGLQGRICWIMLNPSTADETEDDPTIRRCLGFTEREGASVMTVVNLCAYRTAYPTELVGFYKQTDRSSVIGEDNYAWIEREVKAADKVICAWGAGADLIANGKFAELVIDLLDMWGIKAHALGFTKSGQPRHPLMVPKDEPLVEIVHPNPFYEVREVTL